MSVPNRPPENALVRPGKHLGGWFGRLANFTFGNVTVPQETVERLRTAYAQGTVVHVIRTRRVLDPLFVLSVLDRMNLRKPNWMHDHYASSCEGTLDSLLNETVAGSPSLLFLRKPRTLTTIKSSYSENYIEGLVELQLKQERPIMLLPQSLSWKRTPGGIRRSLIDGIFGDRESPGRLREMLGFLLNRSAARYHVGAPIDLKAFCEREVGKPVKTIARKIRWAILNHLTREEAIRIGPAYRSTARIRQTLIKDPAIQQYLRDRSLDGDDIEILQQEADDILKNMVADMRPNYVRVFDALLTRVWRDIYDGISVDRDGLKQVWHAARQGPIVLVPSHKSHVDYLVLSQVFFQDGMLPAHIAAGENLNMPLVGKFLQRCGAFFIRRRFRGDKLYALILSTYVRRLLKAGHAVEFFIEGGRSRTGKQLAPKMGMLSMCVEPVLDDSIRDVWFVPVSISYEKVIEAKSYAKELGGGKKRKENLKSLVSARKFLRSKYGRVYVDFDEPVSLRTFASSRGFSLPRDAEVPTSEEKNARRKFIADLAEKIGHGIDKVTRITSTSMAAAAVLSHTRRGMSQKELVTIVTLMIQLLKDLDARLSDTLQPESVGEAVAETLSRLADDKLLSISHAADDDVIYQIDDTGRRALDYYKNNALHFFAPLSIVALAISSVESETPTFTEVEEVVSELFTILQFEFHLRNEHETYLERALEVLSSHRLIEYDKEESKSIKVTRIGEQPILQLAGLLSVFFEAYRHTLEMTLILDNGPELESSIQKMALQQGEKLVLEGKIRRAEAISKLTVQNATRMLIRTKILERVEGGQLSLGEQGKERRDKMIERMTSLLNTVDRPYAISVRPHPAQNQ
ncbi:MAG: 1-acyl-sn-glycerol-3-phosphate acyltransferase [Myxococcota bacterium]|nr:1-acyl-sn-glycerol-3-phosphate acyltransferase [Myxococcota bacterium]